MLRRKKRVALALGAGGSRGLAHIGVIRALKDSGIPIDCIAGISFGAIIGALYSLYQDIDEVEARLKAYMSSPLFQETMRDMVYPEEDKSRTFFEKIQSTIKQGYFYTRALWNKSFVTPETFVIHMKHLVGDKRFSDLKIPFKCASVDLISGNPIIFTEGELYTALTASCATPGFFPPVRMYGMLLVDGGVAEMIPCYTAKTFNPDYTIGVDVTRSIDAIDEESEIHHSLDVVFRSFDISQEFMNIYLAKELDCLIRPGIGAYPWSDFDHFDLFVEEGYSSAKDKITEIRRRIFWF
ncbi:MAG: patatin-like phospholipase family protein [Desulfomonilia bacterium]|jgi:NTE family protein